MDDSNGHPPDLDDEAGGPDPQDEESEARRLLDELLGGSAEGVALLPDTICLATPRGLERVDRGTLERRPRVDVGGRLLGFANRNGSLALLTDRGRLLVWDEATGLVDQDPPGDPAQGCRRIAGHGGWLALTGEGRLLLVDAGDGTPLARAALPGIERASAMAVSRGDEVLSAEGNMVVRLVRDGQRLELAGHCTLGSGDVLALAETRPEPDGPPVVVAFDEFGWFHVIHRDADCGLDPVSSIQLELDGGVPERAGLYCDGHQVVVASGTSFLHLLDLRPPQGLDDPVLMATVCAGLGLAGVTADQDRVYLADAYRGLVVLDRAMFEVCHDDPELARVELHDGEI